MSKPKPSREERKLRESARGEDCTVNIVGVCNYDPATVVLCHAPSEIKGTALKGSAIHGVFGCHACHDVLDGRRPGYLTHNERLWYWLRAIDRTHRQMLNRGVLVVS